MYPTTPTMIHKHNITGYNHTISHNKRHTRDDHTTSHNPIQPLHITHTTNHRTYNMQSDKTIPCHTRYNHPYSTQPDTTTAHHTQQHTTTHHTYNMQPNTTIPHHTTRYNQPTAHTAGTITYNIRQPDTTTPLHTTRYNHTHIQHKYIKPYHLCTHHTIPLTCMAQTTKSETALQTTHNHTHNKLQPLDTAHCIVTHKTIQPHSCTRQPYPLQPDITTTSPHTHILQERGPDGVRPQTHILIRRRVK